MKKLGAIIALATCVTIGGVYATWNYAQGGANSVDQTFAVSLAGTDITTTKGRFVVDTSRVSISIDDQIGSDGTTTVGDHVAELYITGDITITFTPNAGADETVTTEGVAMEYSISMGYANGTTDPWKYEGVDVFTIDSTKQSINNGNATLTATITADDLLSLIHLNQISLPTLEDYNAFHTVLHTAWFVITVNEVTTTA